MKPHLLRLLLASTALAASALLAGCIFDGDWSGEGYDYEPTHLEEPTRAPSNSSAPGIR